MTAFTFFGCALTAYGPALSLFLITIASDPVKIIILILSAFFWLLSLLISSILWKIVGSFTVRLVKFVKWNWDVFVVSGSNCDWFSVFCGVSRNIQISHLSPAPQSRRVLEETDREWGDSDICQQTHPRLRGWPRVWPHVRGLLPGQRPRGQPRAGHPGHARGASQLLHCQLHHDPLHDPPQYLLGSHLLCKFGHWCVE